MKIRNGFVSNSSSSSFIISGNKNTLLEVKKVVSISDFSEGKIKTVEELKKYADYNWGYNDETKDDEDWAWAKKSYENCLKEINSGNTLYCCRADNSYDNPIGNAIYSGGMNYTIINGKEIVKD